jgi:LCP family protein required for cell wall assembly
MWVRIALWSMGSLLALVLVVAAVVGWWAHGLVDKIGNLSDPVKKAQKDLTLPVANQPAIALVIGSDYRASTDGPSLKGSRSDTLMLVRMDPRTKYISMLSLPRDLYVNIPGVGLDKINAAYSDGGYKLALETVKEVTGVKPNYLITVDFKGFRDLVNKFHGVYIPVDQYYYHVNTAYSEQYSQIDIKPGYQLLDGTNALAFSRYRHTDSDFYRNARQQVFLHAFSQRASSQLNGIGLSQLTTLRDVLDTIASNVQVTGPTGPPSISTMIRYATLAYSIKDRIVSSRLDAQVGGDATNSYVTATPAAIHQAVFGFLNPDTLVRPTQLPHAGGGKKTPKFAPKVDPSTQPVVVVNGNGVTGAASKGAAALQGWGYPATWSQTPSPTGFTFVQNAVYYRPGGAKAAADVAAILGNAQTRPITPAYSAYASKGLVVVVGKDFKGTLAHEPRKTSTTGGLPSDVTRDPSLFRADFAAENRPANFPVLYPTVSQDQSVFQAWNALGGGSTPVRLYNIPAGGHGPNSMYAFWQFDGIAGSYWGIQETHFTAAPVLANPDKRFHVDGRIYQVYVNGSHIHMIAFIQHHTAYWVQNTLRDDMSNPDMIAIARSLKPLH